MATPTDEHGGAATPLPRTDSGTQLSNGGGFGYFSIPFERFTRDELSDFASGFTLLGLYRRSLRARRADRRVADTMETYFDSRLDLLQRNLAKQSDRIKMKADMALQGLRKDILKQMKTPSGDSIPIADNLEKEMQKFKLKVRAADRMFAVCARVTMCSE